MTENIVHAVGSRVWVKDDAEGWVKAEVIKVEGPTVVVCLEGTQQQRKVPQDEAPLQNKDTRGVEVRCVSTDAPHMLSAARWTGRCLCAGV